MNLSKDFLDFLECLNNAKVKYLVVGGYALGFHGYPRYTGDLDIWIERTSTNVEKLLLAVRLFGGPSAEIDATQLLEEPSETNPCPGISFGMEPLRLEIINAISGVNFADCFPRGIVKSIHGVELKYIHVDDLVENKLSTNRLKDKADVEELNKRLKN